MGAWHPPNGSVRTHLWYSIWRLICIIIMIIIIKYNTTNNVYLAWACSLLSVCGSCISMISLCPIGHRLVAINHILAHEQYRHVIVEYLGSCLRISQRLWLGIQFDNVKIWRFLFLWWSFLWLMSHSFDNLETLQWCKWVGTPLWYFYM